MTKSVVLLSGGLDSAVTLALACRELSSSVTALTFRYGQKHEADEVYAAHQIANAYKVEHVVLDLPLGGFKSALIRPAIPIPLDGAARPEAAATYVPARNMIFLAVAAGYAESNDARSVWYGANAIDFSGYPDCRPTFVSSMRSVFAYGLKESVAIMTPLIACSKATIVKMAQDLSVPIELTHTCYAPRSDGACGRCDACRIRLEAFKELGVKDPIKYASDL